MTIDPISRTTHHLFMGLKETDALLSSGSGFIYKFENERYLVTNWHNVSGRSPITGECISPTLGVPDILKTAFRSKLNFTHCSIEHLDLYRDEGMQEPVWYEHPVHGRAVDVVAIPLPTRLGDLYDLFPVNDASTVEFDPEYGIWVADDAFVIGYPFEEWTRHQFPIWKKASIASELDVDMDQLPKLFIDTATRPGLSGSPVIMQRTGIHGKKGELSGKEIIGRIRSFLGVYSGRVGEDQTKAQLGVVWKARVIGEILEAKKIGAPPCAALG